MAQKYENLIFGRTLSAYMSGMPITAHGFLLLRRKCSICSIKHYKNIYGILLAFLVIL